LATLEEHVAMQIACLPRLLAVYFIFANSGDFMTYGKTLALSSSSSPPSSRSPCAVS
jgi:hypothetical protein